MALRPLRLTEPATADLRGIARWTRATFGTRQAQEYRDAFAAALARLRADTVAVGSIGHDDLRPGLRSLHLRALGLRGRHALFYRDLPDGGRLVLRVLHDAMDPVRHLTSAEDRDAPR